MIANLLYLPIPEDASTYGLLDAYPATEAGWRNRYDTLRRCYLVGDYTTGEREYYKLFEARDDDDKRIDWTRRLFATGKFLVDTDARALLGGRCLLETPAAAPTSALAMGEAIWRRSAMRLQLPLAAKMTACLGDYWVEAVRTSATRPYNTTLCFYDPASVTAVYDDIVPTRLRKLIVECQYLDGAEYGTVDDPTPHYMRRTLTETDIVVEVDGKVRDDLSGPHRASTVPARHLCWMPFESFDHGLGAMHGLDVAMMRVDSLVCQVQAGLARFGNPTIVLKGARLDSASQRDAGRLGRVYHNVPKDGALEYLEMAGTAAASAMDMIREVMAHVRETRPEFLFANSAAGESGTARSYLAASFASMIEEVRGHWFSAIEEVTGIAVAMDLGVAYDPDAHVYQIDAPPPLPVDVKPAIEALYLAAGDMRRADRVRALQKYGLLDPSLEPEEYAVQVADEEAAHAGAMLGVGDAPVDTTEAPPPVAQP